MVHRFHILLLSGLFLTHAPLLHSETPTSALDPRETYREIYALITSAETSAKEKNFPQAAQTYQEVLLHLENFQRQFPTWEPEIIQFRTQHAKSQIKKLNAQLNSGENPLQSAPQHEPASLQAPPQQPSPAPSFPPASSLSSQQPIQHHPIQPQHNIVAAQPSQPAPVPLQQHSPPPSYTSPPSITHPQPSHPVQQQLQPLPITQHQERPVSSIVFTQPNINQPTMPLTSSNLQNLAKEVESRIARLEDENRVLRAALAEAESRADVASSYVKVLTRENEFLQAKLNKEIKKLDSIRSLLYSEFDAHSSRWSILQERVKRLLNEPVLPSQNAALGVPAPQNQTQMQVGQHEHTIVNQTLQISKEEILSSPNPHPQRQH